MAGVRSRPTPVSWRALFGWRRITLRCGSLLRDLPDVEEAWRLHRETRWWVATNLTLDYVNISILTSSLSSVSRKRRRAVAAALKLKRIIKGLSSASTVAYTQLYQVSC